VEYPRAGVDYPLSTDKLQAWFGTDEDCQYYLGCLRWPGGFHLPSCRHAEGGQSAASANPSH
jgi:hypothetical protein